MTIKKLFWWVYQPADERERALYSKAYEYFSTFLTGIIGIFATQLVIQNWGFLFGQFSWMRWFFYPKISGLVLIGTVMVSYFVATSKLWKEELSLNTVKKYTPFFNGLIAVMAFLLLGLVFSVFGGWYNFFPGEWPF